MVTSDEELEEYSNLDIVYVAINDVLMTQQAALQRAVQKKRRALESLSKAESEIFAITGAISALQDVTRRLQSNQAQTSDGVQEPAPPPKPEPLKYITLSGEAFLE